jgi:hypothetical protein
LSLDLGLALFSYDFFLSLLLNCDGLLPFALNLDLFKSLDLSLAGDLLLSLDSLTLDSGNGFKSLGLGLHSAGFFLHHGLLSSALSGFSGSLKGLSLLLSTLSLSLFSFGFFSLQLLSFLARNSLLLEPLLFFGLLFLGLIYGADSASVLLLLLLSLDLLSHLGGCSSLDNCHLSFSSGLDGFSGFHNHGH